MTVTWRVVSCHPGPRMVVQCVVCRRLRRVSARQVFSWKTCPFCDLQTGIHGLGDGAKEKQNNG